MMRKFGAFVPQSYRMGKKYWEIRELIARSQFMVREEIENWQLQKLQSIVRYAYDNTVGYRALYAENSIKPQDIQQLKDVHFLPFVTKEMMRDNLKDFSSHLIGDREKKYITTSGSTGIPFGFYHTEVNRQIEKAFINTGYERVGWQLGNLTAILRGSFIGNEKEFWEYDGWYKTLLLSSYYLTERTYKNYINKILEYQPLYLRAYPSLAARFADFIIANDDIGRVEFEVILLGSEKLYDWQMQKISQAFPKSRVMGWYGHTEKVILAPMCEHSSQYHVWPFYGLTEILSDKDEEVEQGDIGELVGTSFWNYATPFIRYRTMDMAKKGMDACEKCNRQFLLLESVEGRAQDVLISKDGRRIPVPSTSIHSNVFKNVKQFQFYQDKPGNVLLKIVKNDMYDNKDTAEIHHEVVKKLGNDIDFNIIFVEKITVTSNGKYKALEQKLDIVLN